MSDYLAQFLAKGGQVKTLPEGASNGMTERDWQYAVRGETPPSKARNSLAGLHAMERDDWNEERRMELLREARHMGGTAAVNDLLGEGF